MSTYFFSGDHHFGHAGARNFYRRPFLSVDDMDREMIALWNSVVEPDDVVWHLGDFAVRQSAERVGYLLDMLHGRKHLIVGNNDDGSVAGCPGWQSVQTYAEMVVDGVKLVLCHYPFRTWRDMGKGSINLHGHSHGKLKPLRHQFDVGVDVWGFRPVQLQEMLRGSKATGSEPVLAT
jgi:calcineurin-like phosphoesterase family protein